MKRRTSILTVVAACMSFNCVPAVSMYSVEKQLDKSLRIELYKQCKADKRNGCHFWSFENAVVYRFL